MSRTCRNIEKSWKPRLHELEHVSKIRLLKTHSHTSIRLGYEAENERQAKRENKRAYPKRRENVKETTAMSPGRGGGRGENVSAERRKPEVAPPPQRGGARLTTEKEKNHISCATVCVAKLPRAAPAPRGGVGRTKKKRTRQTYNPVPQRSGPITQTMARH